MDNFIKSNSTISILDTGIATYNIGNHIIMDAVRQEIEDIFHDHFIVTLPPDDMKTHAIKYNHISQLTFAGGTNLLNANIRKYRQWDLTLLNIMRLKRLVLIGCGWWQYESSKTTGYTKWALHKILSDKYVHSVRDSYTANRLQGIGIPAINTGCPTLWRITRKTTDSIPVSKGDKVIFTLTDYNWNQDRDKKILETLSDLYSKIYFFPQGSGDITYLNALREGNFTDIEIIPPRLDAFNRLLESGGVDYIGTRLHSGIRAIQKGRRSFIIGIDNRATEMAKDFHLPIIKECDIRHLKDIIPLDYHLELAIPSDNINTWKNQFRTIQ